MSSTNINALLELLIKLSSARDPHALEISLAQVIFELVAPGDVRLFRVHSDGVEYNFIAADNINLDRSISQPLRYAMQECRRLAEQTVVAADGMTSLIYPIFGFKKEVIALIVIDSAIQDVHLQYSANLMIKIYHNLIDLINDNERDTLTGLLNRKTFDTKICQVMTKLQNCGQRLGDNVKQCSYCLAIFDIDHFKRVNDQFGHLMGDETLLLFASMMTKVFREEDMLFRFGGEEFIGIISKVDLAMAEHVVERFRTVVESYQFPQVGNVTVSIGLTQILPTDLSATIIDRADEALYFAKEHGRNQVGIYEKLIAEGKLTSQAITGDIELF